MKYLLIVLSVLLGSFAVLWMLDKTGVVALSIQQQGLYSLALFFLVAGLSHFRFTQPMSRMLPPWVPQRSLIIQISGVLEMMGGIGLLMPQWSGLAGICLLVLLISVFPANVYAALHHMDEVGHRGPAFLLVRTPMQIFLMAWTYYFSIRSHP